MNNNYWSMMTMLAAEAAQRAMFKEEEMTNYGDDALSGEWEFKIVRARFGQFRKREEFEALLSQENEFGWVLLEKLDDNRVRFKRHIKERSRDRISGSERDPYRTLYGSALFRPIGVIGRAFLLVVITIMVIAFVGLLR